MKKALIAAVAVLAVSAAAFAQQVSSPVSAAPASVSTGGSSWTCPFDAGVRNVKQCYSIAYDTLQGETQKLRNAPRTVKAHDMGELTLDELEEKVQVLNDKLGVDGVKLKMTLGDMVAKYQEELIIRWHEL